MLRIDADSGEAFDIQGRCRAGNAALAAAGLGWLARREGDASLALRAVRLRELARSDLAPPEELRTTEFAKALLALRFELEGDALSGPPDQSSRSPSSLRAGRPREKR